MQGTLLSARSNVVNQTDQISDFMELISSEKSRK